MKSSPSFLTPKEVAPFMESVYARYHHARWIGRDPLHWAHEYERPEDREIVAFLAASFAYGNVLQIDRTLGNLFRRMGRSPAAFVSNFVPGRSDGNLDGFYHRFNTARDAALLMHLLGQMLREHESLEGFWDWAQRRKGESPGATIGERAGRFIDAALDLDGAPYADDLRATPRPSFRYLLPDAGGASACKRFFLFLRWVVRPADGIDLGLWRVESPAGLEFPVDTHIHRLTRYLGATARNDAGARTRAEITDFFRTIAPDDPVRYDFSLCRLGILKACPSRHERDLCEPCDLKGICLRRRCMQSPRPNRKMMAAIGLRTVGSKPQTKVA